MDKSSKMQSRARRSFLRGKISRDELARRLEVWRQYGWINRAYPNTPDGKAQFSYAKEMLRWANEAKQRKHNASTR